MKKTLEIFKAGTWKATNGETFSFSEKDVADIAASYDPKLHRAPLVVGHPKQDAPAYGWVAALAANKGLLDAAHEQVEAQFADMVNAGRFSTISSSFYAPGAPNNPTPGKYYLRHVGFLGAAPPAVKGLKTPAFAEKEEGVIEFSAFTERTTARLFRQMREFIISKFSVDDADKALSTWDIESLENEATREIVQETTAGFADPINNPTGGSNGGVVPAAEKKPTGHQPSPEGDEAMSQAAIAAQEAELKKKQDELASQQAEFEKREGALKAREAEQAKQVYASFADTLVKGGKLLPREKAGVVEFLASLDGKPTIDFADGDTTIKKSPVEYVKEFLNRLPKQVEFAELGGGAGEDGADNPQVIADKARAYQAEQAKLGVTVSAAQAVTAVSKR